MRPLFAVLLLLCAAAPRAAEAPAADAIAWFASGVDEAFAQGAQAGKPVFLYWGAEWCPPCNQLKATVFRRPAFIEQTRHFIAVYLDGDQPGAQKWAEYFAMVGYPAMIVFRPDRTELTRISGGMDLEQYPRVLELARRQTQPIAALLARAQAAPRELAADDWSVLALYGWVVDDDRALGGAPKGPVLARLAADAPRPELRTRFGLLALVELVKTAKNPRQVLAAQGAAPARQLLLTVLADPALVRANLVELQAYGANLVTAASAPASAERKVLVAALRAAMDAVFADATYTVAERLQTADTLLALYKIERAGQPADKALATLLRERALWANQEAQTPYERQAVIGTAADLLAAAGAPDQAEALLRTELASAHRPYYHMVSLAAFAERRGDAKGALDLLRRAWESAEGTATRAQWGIYYVDGLLRLTPTDRKTIEAVVSRMIDELAADPDAYYQRTRRRIGDLGATLARWSAQHEGAKVIAHLRERMAAVCKPLPAASEVRRECEGFAAT